MADLAELLERVKAATGPDREIDAEIYNALIEDAGRKAFRVSNWTRGRAPMLDRYHDGWLTGKSEDDIYANNLARFTASLDAALALVERVLPGPSPHLWRFRECGWGARLDADDDYGAVLAQHTYSPSPALALLAALLSALAAQNSVGDYQLTRDA